MTQTWGAPSSAVARTGVELVGGGLTDAAQVIPYGCNCHIVFYNMNWPIVPPKPESSEDVADGILVTGSVYIHYITVTNDYGESVLSDPSDTITIAKAGDLGSITITWTDPTSVEGPLGHPPTGIKIYQQIDGGDILLLASVALGVETYTDDGDPAAAGAAPTADSTGKNAVIAIDEAPDVYGRETDSTDINPVTVPAGTPYVLGPYSDALYGLGDTAQELHLTVTCDNLGNCFIIPVRTV